MNLIPDYQPWMADALCTSVGGDIFYPEAGRVDHQAVRVCERCPAREACLQYAIDNQEVHGIWAGTYPSERKKMWRAVA